ncbi:uncharacterized protein LOC143569794 [Bidens hawaiensis]|uniref:uncharacterized protein LOC143569794 n=1 Tax=Bidens hawaiensis TaxID=980011 RepID=UPI00404B0000
MGVHGLLFQVMKAAEATIKLQVINKIAAAASAKNETDIKAQPLAHASLLLTYSPIEAVAMVPGGHTTTLNPFNQAVIGTRDQEQQILMLTKHVAHYSIKEAQMHSEKSALEKRIAYMRLVFDQQQKDLVDAESKALSYRQDIIEENIRMTYAFQDAEEERSTFVSSLMSFLAEYSLQPSVVDAQSIFSNVKVCIN